MIHNRTDFYFSDIFDKPSSADMPRIIAVVEAWLACPVKIHREGSRLMMALSRCRSFSAQYVNLASRQIERYLKVVMKHNSAIERSWHRDPANPQPGPVLVCEFVQPSIDEDGVPVSSTLPAVDGGSSSVSVITPKTEEETMDFIRRHYKHMHDALSADPRAHADDITRAACLSLLETESPEQPAPAEQPVSDPAPAEQPISEPSVSSTIESSAVEEIAEEASHSESPVSASPVFFNVPAAVELRQPSDHDASGVPTPSDSTPSQYPFQRRRRSLKQ